MSAFGDGSDKQAVLDALEDVQREHQLTTWQLISVVVQVLAYLTELGS